MMSPEIDLKKTKAIIFECDILTSSIYKTKALEAIKKANEKGIPVIIKCGLIFEYSDIQNLMVSQNLIVTLTNMYDITSDLQNKNLQKNDCFFVNSENDLNALSDKIGHPPLQIKRGAPNKNNTTPKFQTSTSSSCADKQKFMQVLNSTLDKRKTPQDQHGIFTEMQKNTPEKIEAIVFDHTLLSEQLTKLKIVDIIMEANQKNIPVIIYCEDINSHPNIKLMADMNLIKVTITEKSDLKDCLWVTPKTNLEELSEKIKIQPKNIRDPEKDLLAKNIAKIYNVNPPPLVTLKNKHLLTITLTQPNEFLNTTFRKYNYDTPTKTKTIEIESREQIEMLANDHGCYPAKLYNDAELKYSPMPKVITAIVIEHDLLIQFSEKNESPKYQSQTIDLIRKAHEKNIPIIIRIAKTEIENDLISLCKKENIENAASIINQSEFTMANIKKNYNLEKEDFLYVTIPGSTLYKTDTGNRTHVLLIDSEEDIDYLAEKIKNQDKAILSSEKMLLSKNIRNNCHLSKTPFVELVRGDVLHIVMTDEEDAQKLNEYCKKYSATLYQPIKTVRVESPNEIEKFITDNDCDVHKLYNEAGLTFKNDNSCTQQ